MIGIFYIFLYFIIVISPLALVFLTGPVTDHGYIYETGKAFALMAVMIIMMQFVLSSRQKWIEKHFGLDIIFRFHKGIAIIAGLLVICHPILLAFGSGKLELLYSLQLPWYILLGQFGMILILALLIISLFREKLKIKFENWRTYHNVLAVFLLAGIFVHSMIAGGHSDLSLASLQVLWYSMLVIAVFFYVYHKFYVPAVLTKNNYVVDNVIKETHDVWTLEMKPEKTGKVYDYEPGQFHFLKIQRKDDLPVEEHHFTISSSPRDKEKITSTIKESGDFTSTIGETGSGDPVSIEGPFGRFSNAFHQHEDDLVFIAGGIGITPLMSMLRYMHDVSSNKRVTLLYANRTEEDIVFREELDNIQRSGSPRLEIIYFLDNPADSWEGESGYINEEKMLKKIDDIHKRSYYICCPEPMREVVLSILSKLKVDKDRIHLEIFSL